MYLRPLLPLFLLCVIAAAALAAAPAASKENKYDRFAQCLSESGAAMYGAFWCDHCREQKEMFGDSWQFIRYFECHTPGTRQQNFVCRAAGIRRYPTWVFADNQRREGKLSLQELSEKTGCVLP